MQYALPPRTDIWNDKIAHFMHKTRVHITASRRGLFNIDIFLHNKRATWLATISVYFCIFWTCYVRDGDSHKAHLRAENKGWGPFFVCERNGYNSKTMHFLSLFWKSQYVSLQFEKYSFMILQWKTHPNL